MISTDQLSIILGVASIALSVYIYYNPYPSTGMEIPGDRAQRRY